MGILKNNGATPKLVVLSRSYKQLGPQEECEVLQLTNRELNKIQANPDLVLTGNVELIHYRTFVDFEVVAAVTLEAPGAPEPEVASEPVAEETPEADEPAEISYEGFKTFVAGLSEEGDDLMETLKGVYKKTDLMSMCVEAGISDAGNKEDLIARLLESV